MLCVCMVPGWFEFTPSRSLPGFISQIRLCLTLIPNACWFLISRNTKQMVCTFAWGGSVRLDRKTWRPLLTPILARNGASTVCQYQDIAHKSLLVTVSLAPVFATHKEGCFQLMKDNSKSILIGCGWGALKTPAKCFSRSNGGVIPSLDF